MKDLHVASLIYTLWTPDDLKFESALPRSGKETEFAWTLKDGVLTVDLKANYASDEDARARVDPFLRAWSLDDALRRGRPSLEFDFERAVFEHRSPVEGGQSVVASVLQVVSKSSSSNAFLQEVRQEYPAPPASSLKATPEVDYMWRRFAADVDRKDNLLVMGYYCLSMAKTVFGGRTKAADALRISTPVFRNLGILTAEGNPGQARKIQEGQQALSPDEERWVRDVVKRLIRRVAETQANPKNPLPKITMDDFPPIVARGGKGQAGRRPMSRSTPPGIEG